MAENSYVNRSARGYRARDDEYRSERDEWEHNRWRPVEQESRYVNRPRGGWSREEWQRYEPARNPPHRLRDLIRPGAYDGQSVYTGTPVENDEHYAEREYSNRLRQDDRERRDYRGDAGAGSAWGRLRESARRLVGRPPKGYRRSDERVKEDICERIMSRGDIDAGDVMIEVSAGRVTLDGVVIERWMKYAIEDIADQCSGVEDIENRVRVGALPGSERTPGSEAER